VRGPGPKGGGQKEAHGGVLLRTGYGALQRASSKGKGRCPCGCDKALTASKIQGLPRRC
jgi:hypothetical protein